MQMPYSVLQASREWFLRQACRLSRQILQESAGAARTSLIANARMNGASRPAMEQTRAIGSAALALRARRLVERGAQAPGELDRIVVGPKMHEDQARLLGQHVAVDRRPLDAVLAQHLDHRIDFLAGQHEVAGDRRLAAAGRLEIDCRRNAGRTGRGELGAAFSDRIAPRDAELIDAAVGRTLRADDLIELRE